MSEQDFIRCYEEYADPLFRHCYLRVFERERARELVQETFTRTWQYTRSGKKVEHMRAFLYRVLNNIIVDEARRTKPVSLDALQEEGFEPSIDERDRIVRTIEGKALRTLLDRMDRRHRQVLILRYVDDFAPQEIASITGETANAISVRLHRAVRALRALGQDYG